MTIEWEWVEEKSKRDKALEFYESKIGGHTLLRGTPQSAKEVVDKLTALIPRHSFEVVEMAKYYSRNLQTQGVISKSDAYFIMYQICDRYALKLIMSTNVWEHDPAKIKQLEEFANGFLALTNETIE